MTDAELQRALRSVGMAALVTHPDLFQSPADPASRAETLALRTGWAATACRTRVNYAQAILTAGRLRDALELIAAAERVAPPPAPKRVRCWPDAAFPAASPQPNRPPGRPRSWRRQWRAIW